MRVNRFSLALLRLFRRPLPEIFGEAFMTPLGASTEWRWRGYRNSTVEIDGRAIESVSGGGHWGGGVFIHARDQARIGLMMQRRGSWGGPRSTGLTTRGSAAAACRLRGGCCGATARSGRRSS